MLDPTDYFQRQWEDLDPMTAEINRLRDENSELRGLVSDMIQGARRDRSMLIQRLGPLHVIKTRVTKGQVLRGIAAINSGEGQ